MKRYILLGVLIFTGFIMARAQVNRGDEGVQLGLKVGANLSNVYDESGQDFVADAKSGLAAGVFLRLPLGKFIGLQPEVMFSQKGFKATGRPSIFLFNKENRCVYRWYHNVFARAGI